MDGNGNPLTVRPRARCIIHHLSDCRRSVRVPHQIGAYYSTELSVFVCPFIAVQKVTSC